MANHDQGAFELTTIRPTTRLYPYPRSQLIPQDRKLGEQALVLDVEGTWRELTTVLRTCFRQLLERPKLLYCGLEFSSEEVHESGFTTAVRAQESDTRMGPDIQISQKASSDLSVAFVVGGSSRSSPEYFSYDKPSTQLGVSGNRFC
ncbi:hypothetical protein BYT27DRAFT_7246527 [Phlegmacium glaucopus]|nr:hypothetical protein BYT27DRAFT_7246527 [Phlegmacium glaucopus]